MIETTYRLSDISEVATSLVNELSAGTVVLLTGEMGAGKTTLVRAICAEMGRESGVCSPTFNLVNCYKGDPCIYHMDLYRLTGEMDMLALDLDRYFSDTTAITFVEWPERLGDFAPDVAQKWDIQFDPELGEDARVIRRVARSPEA